MGLLRWLRGGGDNPSATATAGALTELDANLSPAKRQQIENLETLEALREEEGHGDDDDRRGVDLDGGTATVRIPQRPDAAR